MRHENALVARFDNIITTFEHWCEHSDRLPFAVAANNQSDSPIRAQNERVIIEVVRFLKPRLIDIRLLCMHTFEVFRIQCLENCLDFLWFGHFFWHILASLAICVRLANGD